jgi:hypothetical protein
LHRFTAHWHRACCATPTGGCATEQLRKFGESLPRRSANRGLPRLRPRHRHRGCCPANDHEPRRDGRVRGADADQRPAGAGSLHTDPSRRANR